MPEFEPDKKSIRQAENLSAGLMQDLRKVLEGSPSEFRRGMLSEENYAGRAEGVPINDVVANANQMAAEFAIARRWDNQILSLKLDNGELVPISITELFGSSFWLSNFGDFSELWERPDPFAHNLYWRDMLQRSGLFEEQVVISDVRDTLESVQSGLNSFLSYRFAGMKKWGEWIQGIGFYRFGDPKGPSSGKGAGGIDPPPPPAVGSGGGLQVQVSCLTPGLRIHISPAYFINWVFFGSPTTPVASYVLPGRYVFAGDGPMLPWRRKDHGVFSIPPTYHPTLTRF